MATATSNDTRERILRATLRLIGEHGVGAISNRRIAAASEVALGSLTYHFPSQSELLREALMLYVHEEVGRMQEIAAELRRVAPTPASAAAEVEAIVARSSSRLEEIAELELHLQASRDPALQEASERCFAAYEELAAVALSALNVPDPQRHARAVVAVMCGLGVRRLGSGRSDAEGVAQALLTIVAGASVQGQV
ncbi:MAG TPA: TetR family transcriptional regulator [Solirubrobacteraceae bacterium]|jgi:AcrR family transcriptional regulator|nr:TetR family transcriptional regulator [Solirubrobacteraceae bacterium]